MDDAHQAWAYAQADFSIPHKNIINRFEKVFSQIPEQAKAIDLGCGSADIAIRLARMYKHWQIDAVDGSQAMLTQGQQAVKEADLEQCIRLKHNTLPDERLAKAHYDVVVSNSLLHHLHRPQVLWGTIKQIAKPQALIFIADLRRPNSKSAAKKMVEQYAASEPDIMRHDFYHSLLAAFTREEISQQLDQAGINTLRIEELGNRHIIIYGTLAVRERAS